MFTRGKSIYYLLRTTLHVVRQGGTRLTSEKLTRLNAHPNFSFYCTIVFWADYCGVDLQEVVSSKSFEVVRMLIYYVRLFDDIVDTPTGITDFVAHPNLAKTHTELHLLTSAIAKWICDADISREKKIIILEAIRDFRKKAIFLAYRKGLELQIQNKITVSELIPIIEDTSGLWYITCIRIMNILHNIRPETGKKIESIFGHWMVAMQMADDAFDYPEDRQSKSLSFIAAFLLQFPEEQRKIDALFKRATNPNWSWLRSTAPKTYKGLEKLFFERLDTLASVDPQNATVYKIQQSTIAAFYLASTYTSVLKLILPIMESWNNVLKRFDNDQYRNAP